MENVDFCEGDCLWLCSKNRVFCFSIEFYINKLSAIYFHGDHLCYKCYAIGVKICNGVVVLVECLGYEPPTSPLQFFPS